MKKVIACLLVLALTAAVSIGATLAYLTDTDEDVNVMTLGKVKIDQLEYERVDTETKDAAAEVQEFHDNKPLLPTVIKDGLDYSKPGDTYVDWAQIGKDGYTSPIWNPELINNEVDKMVFVKNKGDYDAYVRSVFAFEAGKYTTLDQFRKMVHLNLNTTDYTWEWVETPVTIGESTYFVATATYNKVLAPGALTEISLSQITLDKTATNEDVEAFGDTYQVLVKSQGIQADGFTDADTALNEGFGAIASNNVPWENDSPIRGIDLLTALHYYEGNKSNQITAKVTNVVFGLNEKFSAITEAYDGVLVDVDQDIPVYAYYVPNGNNYDVYFLANDEIYTPVDSSGLFKDMTALKTVGTANLDVSRTVNMFEMFRNCTALTEVDVSGWDTGNVTSMKNAFRNCKVLPEINVADWDTSKVTDMAAMFRECKAVTELNTAKWDISNVTNFAQTFAICDNLQIVHTSDWDTSGATTFSWMFYECRKLHTLDVSGWNTSNVTDLAYTFDNCKSLEVLELGGWNTSNVTTMDHTFASRNQNAFDMKFTELDVGNWDTRKVTKMNSMFYGCGSLTKLDLSGWDVSKVTTVNHMLSDCNHLTELNLKGWDTSSLVVMDCFLNDCDALTVVDVSTFKTHNVKDFCQVFDNCEALTQIIGLENWDTSNGLIFEEMFAGCPSLKELNLSSFNTRNALDKYKSEADTYNGFQSMFTGTNGLEKLILGANFSFDGDGKVTTASYKASLPAPAAKEGYTAKWKNVDTGVAYLASEIPEETAATYVPYYEYVAKGATVYNALNYLNADPNGKKITANVTNITFGLRKDYEEIASQYTGVLVDAEQEGPAYAYYVPNGSTSYDLYVLADDVIYAPANSASLFSGMSALTGVDTGNLSFSRTEIMERLFFNCTKLKNLNATDWDLSSVKDMNGMFYCCTSLESLDVSKWDLGNVTNMYCAFGSCEKLAALEVGDWDVSSVVNMGYVFYHAYALEELDVAEWDVSNVTNFQDLFGGLTNQDRMALKKIDVSNWDVSSATNLRDMFYGCGKLTELDLSNWDVRNVTTMSHMFTDCIRLEKVNLSGWQTPNLTTMDGMFNDCRVMKTVDLSMFDTSKVTEFSQMFEACGSLEKIIGLENFVTTSGHDFSEMFSGCGSLKELNLSTFDTRQANSKYLNDGRYTNLMFQSFMGGCTKLEKITFGPYLSFDGDGSAPNNYKFVMPAASGVPGWDGHWYHVQTGVGYQPSEIPEETAATYVAVNPNP